MILIFSRSPQPDKISLSADIVCALAQKTCLKTLYNSFTLQKKKYHHSTFANSAETIQQRDRKKMAPTKAQFLADVELELDFLKTYPVANSQERKKAEKDRKAVNKMMRKTERQYQGPSPITDAIRAQEKLRQASLSRKYKRSDANWSRVRKEAEFQFKIWTNRQLKAELKVKTEELNLELAELEAASLLLEEKTLERNKLLESRKIFRQQCNE